LALFKFTFNFVSIHFRSHARALTSQELYAKSIKVTGESMTRLTELVKDSSIDAAHDDNESEAIRSGFAI
jgi:hypothetical protein